jgi:glycerol-3-phosphate dehydrogenase
MKRELKKLSDRTFDVLIIGAGIYGATAAWEAASRGLSVALIDKDDFGGATSANSLKIVHGGLRYLQTLDVERMRESIHERRILLKIAPHLVHPLSCLMPTYGHLMKGREVMQVGMLMNDIISIGRNRHMDPQKKIPPGKTISKEKCLKIIPGIQQRKLSGGALWTDAQMYNSERLLLSFVLSAVQRGAVAVNYLQADDFLKHSDHIEGIRATDKLTGEVIEIQARVVLNTCGGWINALLQSAGMGKLPMQLSTAMNLIINKPLLSEYAVGITGNFESKRPDGSIYLGRRVLFMAPWRHVILVGTYHRPYHQDPDQLRVTESEIEDFLKEVNSALPGSPIRRDEVSFVHKGFLPMDGIQPKTGEVRLTPHYRIHNHQRELKGLISVIGVKYTTARDVSKKSIDLVFRMLGYKPIKSISHQKPLVGGEIDRFESFLSESMDRLSKTFSPGVSKHLIYNYGSEYRQICLVIEDEPNMGKLVAGSSEVLSAQIVHSVREEMAVKLADVVLRRTDLGSSGYPGDKAVWHCAEIMAKELKWKRSRIQDEINEVKTIYSNMKSLD